MKTSLIRLCCIVIVFGCFSSGSSVFGGRLSFQKQLENFNFEKNRGTALLLMQDDEIIYERYAEGFHENTQFLSWSITKSIFSLITGMAAFEGKINLSESICYYLSEIKKNDELCKVLVVHLLNFTSGIDWQELYEGKGSKSSISQILYGYGAADIVSFILKKHRLRSVPGIFWSYSSGDTILLSAVLQRAYGQEAYEELVLERFPKAFGLESFTVEQDPKGVFYASSYSYLSARDLAKIGSFMLKRSGKINGRQVMFDNWVRYSTSFTKLGKQGHYLYNPLSLPANSWWINISSRDYNIRSPIPYASETYVSARGHWGQLLSIDPEKNLVVVRYGDDRQKRCEEDELMRLIYQFVDHRAVDEKPELVGNPHLLAFDKSLRSYGEPGLKLRLKTLLFRSFRAKMFCSCYYIIKPGDDEYCDEYSHFIGPKWAAKIEKNETRRLIRVNRKKSQFISEEKGCNLFE